MLWVKERVSENRYIIGDTLHLLHSADISNMSGDEEWSVGDIRYFVQNGMKIHGVNEAGDITAYKDLHGVLGSMYARYTALGKPISFTDRDYIYREKSYGVGDILAISDNKNDNILRAMTCFPRVVFENTAWNLLPLVTVEHDKLPQVLPDWCECLHVDFDNSYGFFDNTHKMFGKGVYNHGVFPGQYGAMEWTKVVHDRQIDRFLQVKQDVKIIGELYHSNTCTELRGESPVEVFVELPNTVEYLYQTFRGVPFATGSKILPESLKYIGRMAFRQCDFRNLVCIRFPKGLKAIGKEAFMYAENVKGLMATLPEGLEVIGDNAFSDLKDYSWLGSLKIPSSVRYIGAGAFENTYIEEVTFGGKRATFGLSCFRSSMRDRVTKLVLTEDTIIDIPGAVNRDIPFSKLADKGRYEITAILGVSKIILRR